MIIKRTIFVLSAVALFYAGGWIGMKAVAKDTPVTAPAATGVSAAANNFLALLDDSQRSKVLFNFNDGEQRARWSNFPLGIFQRAGLQMGQLTQPQRDAAMAILKAALSPQGYERVSEIVAADEVLKQTDGGGQLLFGKDLYYIAFLGKPSATEPWMIQFGGHHLGLNITLDGDKGTMAPSHTGAQPAHYELEGKLVRPLGAEQDKAFALLDSLSIDQRKKAILDFGVHDLVLGPGRDGQKIQPEGIKGSDLTGKQKEMLLDLAGEWTGMESTDLANAKMEEMKKNIDDTWFAWAGLTKKGAAAYFRIQGPTVHIEYAPQGLGGDPTNHIHTIYRDPTNDYGAKWSKS